MNPSPMDQLITAALADSAKALLIVGCLLGWFLVLVLASYCHMLVTRVTRLCDHLVLKTAEVSELFRELDQRPPQREQPLILETPTDR